MGCWRLDALMARRRFAASKAGAHAATPHPVPSTPRKKGYARAPIGGCGTPTVVTAARRGPRPSRSRSRPWGTIIRAKPVRRRPTNAEEAQLVAILQESGLIEAYADEQGREPYQLTDEGVRVRNLLAMVAGVEVEAVLESLLSERPCPCPSSTGDRRSCASLRATTERAPRHDRAAFELERQTMYADASRG
jgi:hypothetical protein